MNEPTDEDWEILLNSFDKEIEIVQDMVERLKTNNIFLMEDRRQDD